MLNLGIFPASSLNTTGISSAYATAKCQPSAVRGQRAQRLSVTGICVESFLEESVPHASEGSHHARSHGTIGQVPHPHNIKRLVD